MAENMLNYARHLDKWDQRDIDAQRTSLIGFCWTLSLSYEN
jgi:hypothetical protein